MIEYLIPDWPASSTVHAVTTLRTGGVSIGAYASFNLADHVGDDAVAVGKNRQQLRERLSLQQEPFWLNQVHGTDVLEWDGAAQTNVADAALTRKKQCPCVVLTADCLPVLLCDREGTVVAAVHAGWKSLLNGVIEATVIAMGLPGEQLLAWLGPAIGPTAFEVGDEVRDQFMAVDAQAADAFVRQPNDKWLANIFLLGKQRLQRVGVWNVYGGHWCTYRDPQRFFSFRRDRDTGRLATLIWMTE